MSPVRLLLSTTSRRTRTLLVATVVSGLCARAAVFATATGIVDERVGVTTVLAIVATAMWLVHRAVSSMARPDVVVDVNRAASRALLESDVLAVESEDLHRVVWEGEAHARGLVGTTLPALLADIGAAAVLVPFAASALPARVTTIAAAALAALAVTTFALRRTLRRLQEAVLEAGRLVGADLTTAIDGRLEVVATGGERDHATRFESTLDRYRSTSRRSSLAAAIIGRAPLAVGAGVVALVALVDATARDAVATVVFGRALVLAAAAAPVLSAVLAINDLLRTSILVRPFVELLASPRRPELERDNGDAPKLPADVVAKDVAFAYGENAPAVFTGVSFHWRKGQALVLAGPNGSGKSSLLRLLVGLRPPTSGVLSLGGRPLDEIDLVALRKKVSFLPQRPHLGEPSTTVGEVLGAKDEALRKALEAVGLSLAGDRLVGELSAGQRQRLALARVIIQQREVVLLDEPDANLDAAGVRMVERLVGDMVGRGRMVAVAAHAADFATLGGCRVDLANDSKQNGSGSV